MHQIYSAQHFNNSAEAAATAAVEAGVDWDCYGPYAAYSSAVNMGLLQESALDRAITRVLTAHVRLGFFDSPGSYSEPKQQHSRAAADNLSLLFAKVLLCYIVGHWTRHGCVQEAATRNHQQPGAPRACSLGIISGDSLALQ